MASETKQAQMAGRVATTSHEQEEIKVPMVIARKLRNFSGDVRDDHLKADYAECVSDEDAFDICVRVNVAVNVEGQGNVLLPVDDPESRKNYQEKHEARVGDDGEKISRGGGDAGRRSVGGFFRFAKKKQDAEEHQQHAERGDAKNIFDTDVFVDDAGDIRSSGAADIHERVINGVAHTARAFL